MPDVPGLPSAEELAALPHEELAARLAEAYRLIAGLSARVERLEKRLARDSSTSSRPPSSDSPYEKDGKKPRDRSLREKGKRRPGKQHGEPGTTMSLVDNPKYRYWYPPAECRRCGTGLAGGEVFAQRRHQVTDIKPAPEPEVSEHVVQSKRCPCCGEVTEGVLPPGIRARASFGPETHAQAANLTCGNYVPSRRAAALMAQMAGIRVSAGWIAGVRAKAAALLGSSGFMDLVKELLRQAEAVHADETPARAAGGMRYVHLACTRFLTHMHTGDRSADAVDAGGVLPGYQGILVRDGYHGGYGHLTDALHAWCGAHYPDIVVMPIRGRWRWHSRWASAVLVPSRCAEDLFAGWWQLIGALGAVPRTLVWDGEGAVGRWRGGRSELTAECQAFRGTLAASVYICRPRDPEAKGLVERFHDYLERSFLPGRAFVSPADFNAQLAGWLETVNHRYRRHLECAPADRIAADRAAMIALPPVAPVTGWRRTTRLPRDHYIRLDANDYSVDPAVIGRRIEITAGLDRVRVWCEGRLAADHERAWARHQTITDPAHLAAAQALRSARRLLAPVTGPADAEVEYRDLAIYDLLSGSREAM